MGRAETPAPSIAYQGRRHAAARTDAFVFNQLIPYIGNKRKLLDLLDQAITATAPPPGAVFADLFAGSGVVSRLAKQRGLVVVANDWEPYARAINGCFIGCNRLPSFAAFGGYEAAIDRLNALPPRDDWVTRHLCPADDDAYDVSTERLFYMRKNGRRIDAIRHEIEQWKRAGAIDDAEEACLLAPLLYQACYRSNTSGVFKGFHRGWGGSTRTALYRIATDLVLSPAVFHDNGHENRVLCADALAVAESLRGRNVFIAYIDPPYNQHPYGSNYHVLNSIALWDKPAISPRITRGDKSAIRTDWRTQRRSAYNHRGDAPAAYRRLLETLDARYVVTSYSTDGTIPLDDLLAANLARGHVRLFLKGYKRYRVSSQRFSLKPMNVEFVVVTDTKARRRPGQTVGGLRRLIETAEQNVLKQHLEASSEQYMPGLRRRLRGRIEAFLGAPPLAVQPALRPID